MQAIRRITPLNGGLFTVLPKTRSFHTSAPLFNARSKAEEIREPREPRKHIPVEEIAPTDSQTNLNENITDILAVLAKNSKNNNEPYKYKAYVTAIGKIKAHPKKIETAEEALQLPGIGKMIGSKIREILETGRLKWTDELDADPRKTALKQLVTVYGIGPAAANKLVDQGVKTVEDLKQLPPGQLTQQQQLGLKYYEDFKQIIPREEAEQILKLVQDALAKIESGFRVELCGSYRRKVEINDGIHLLVSHPKYTVKIDEAALGTLREKLASAGVLIDDVTVANNKYLGVCRVPDSNGKKHAARIINIHITPIERWYYELMHLTGTGEFCHHVRADALTKGFLLSERGLFPLPASAEDASLEVNSEEEIFKHLGKAYIPPERRDIK